MNKFGPTLFSDYSIDDIISQDIPNYELLKNTLIAGVI
jgi:hypothetical protein